MASCCDGEGYEAVFTDRFARRVATRYRKRGLDATSARIVDFVSGHDIQGASVLEIGGGVGEIQLELLRRGAARATNLEISKNYEAEARGLLERSGLTDRVTRRFVDIAESPADVEQADIVVLHRVVCCYPDYERLLSAAGSHARRLLVFSHPPDNLVSRGLVGAENLLARLRRADLPRLRAPGGGHGVGAGGHGPRPEVRAPGPGLARRRPRAGPARRELTRPQPGTTGTYRVRHGATGVRWSAAIACSAHGCRGSRGQSTNASVTVAR